MSARRLELDFKKTAPRPGWASWTLLAIAIAFCLDLGWTWYTLKNEIARKEARTALRGTDPRNAQALLVAARAPREGELEAARDTLRRLSVPWNALFGALEAAQSDRAWLLSIEPDPQSGTVTLTGEARDYLAALSYLANLERQRTLSRVHLVRHEVRQGDPQRPLAFVISAAWKPRP